MAAADYKDKMNLTVFEPLHLERSWELEQYRKIGGYKVWEEILANKPPRPRRPEAFTFSMISSRGGLLARISSHTL